MSNLVLTMRCNRRCSYCFAEEGGRREAMSLSEAARVMDMVLAAGQDQVRLLGGEPTLHPEFPAILHAGLDRGLQVLVFSNGLMPPASLTAVQDAPPEQCHVLLNLNVGGEAPETEGKRLRQVAETLGARASVGVNLYRPGLPLAEAAAFARQHGLARVIRLGLAHPRLDRRNQYLHPRHYARVGAEIEAFFDQISPEGFSLTFDCGFVPCMFRPEFLDVLGLAAEDLGHRCGPIPDVLPDLSAIHCFSLGDLDQIPLADAATMQEVRHSLTGRSATLSAVGVFRECADCTLRAAGHCAGGCRSAALLRARRTARAAQPRPDGPAPPSPSQLWAVPYVDQPLDFWQALAAEFGPAIREVYFPLGLTGVGSGRPPQPSVHLEALLRAAPLPLAVLVNPVVLPQPLETIAPPVVEALARLHEEHGVRAATLSDPRLAERVRQRLPGMRLAASCLLEVAEPGQAEALGDLFEVLVPATRVLRHPARLAAIRQAFAGQVRLLVNEGCLDHCLDRKQHFYEMATWAAAPASLCAERLAAEPWRRLTGAWVLPQHLDLIAPYADEFKLAGRVTLRTPDHYRRVLRAYVTGQALGPHEIGGGPATPLTARPWSRELARATLHCDHVCGSCMICRRAWKGEAAP